MLSSKELRRYHRHIILPGFGKEAQQKLKKSSVLVIGAGGLGCPVLQYLSAAGVAYIGIIDGDKVEESNLHRQILFNQDDIGKNKALCAADKLKKQNPYIQIHPIDKNLDKKNALEIIEQYDLIADGSDNFTTRYLVNDACVIKNKPFVFGSIFKFEGQVSVFNYQEGPTYRCLYPEPPSPDEIPNCADIGVIGVLPGIVGTLQANEAIKVLAGIGEVASGKLLLLDALSFNFNTIQFSPVKENKNISQLDDYEVLCGIKTEHQVPEIDVFELKEKFDKNEDVFILDVRNEEEYRFCNLGGLHIHHKNIDQHLDKIPHDREVVVHCHHGSRSKKAIQYLHDHYNFDNLVNLKGGIHEWSLKIDDSVPVYD